MFLFLFQAQLNYAHSRGSLHLLGPCLDFFPALRKISASFAFYSYFLCRYSSHPFRGNSCCNSFILARYVFLAQLNAKDSQAYRIAYQTWITFFCPIISLKVKVLFSHNSMIFSTSFDLAVIIGPLQHFHCIHLFLFPNPLFSTNNLKL